MKGGSICEIAKLMVKKLLVLTSYISKVNHRWIKGNGSDILGNLWIYQTSFWNKIYEFSAFKQPLMSINNSIWI